MPVAASYDHGRGKAIQGDEQFGMCECYNWPPFVLNIGGMINGQKIPGLRDSGSQWNCAPEHDCVRNWFFL